VGELAKQWYQAGSLLIQAGFLTAAFWSVRAILKCIRASQEQMDALVRLTLGGAHSEDNARAGVRPTPYLLDSWPETAPASLQTVVENKDKGTGSSLFAGLIGWLQEPMASSGIGPWRRMLRWLQAPAGS
jgi:hypothetical protein